MTLGRIRVGIGGWTYEPWRGTFYPEGLPHARELTHAAGRLGAIEINGTFYSLQKPESFRKWAAAVPDDFVFTVKASRYCTNRKILGEAGEAIERFVGQGLTELGNKLGPILWQFAHTKRFEPDDFSAFLSLLPAERDGIALRHALEVRHESFVDPAFLAMARAAGAAVVFADKAGYPTIEEQTGSFTYARLQDAREEEAAGYNAAALDHWTQKARDWTAGGRDVFIFMINGAKARAPAAAEALIARLAGQDAAAGG